MEAIKLSSEASNLRNAGSGPAARRPLNSSMYFCNVILFVIFGQPI